jgi:hypothetical protein
MDDRRRKPSALGGCGVDSAAGRVCPKDVARTATGEEGPNCGVVCVVELGCCGGDVDELGVSNSARREAREELTRPDTRDVDAGRLGRAAGSSRVAAVVGTLFDEKMTRAVDGDGVVDVDVGDDDDDEGEGEGAAEVDDDDDCVDVGTTNTIPSERLLMSRRAGAVTRVFASASCFRAPLLSAGFQRAAADTPVVWAWLPPAVIVFSTSAAASAASLRSSTVDALLLCGVSASSSSSTTACM